MTARERLLEREAYNSRSFAIVRPEDVDAVEREAVLATLDDLQVKVERLRAFGGTWDDALLSVLGHIEKARR
jgi:hypothetical protein